MKELPKIDGVIWIPEASPPRTMFITTTCKPLHCRPLLETASFAYALGLGICFASASAPRLDFAVFLLRICTCFSGVLRTICASRCPPRPTMRFPRRLRVFLKSGRFQMTSVKTAVM